MSFSTVIEIEYSDESIQVDLELKKDDVLHVLNSDGIHHDVYADLLQLFVEKRTELHLHPIYCFELLEKISSLFPEVNFLSRGLGEEYIFTWVSAFENGTTSFKNLAWENENPFI